MVFHVLKYLLERLMQMFQWELMIKKKKEKLYNLIIDKRKYFTICIVKSPKWNARIPFR